MFPYMHELIYASETQLDKYSSIFLGRDHCDIFISKSVLFVLKMIVADMICLTLVGFCIQKS